MTITTVDEIKTPRKRCQRGRELELRIERVFDQLNCVLPGIIAIRIEVRQARVRGRLIYCKRQPFDYLVMGRGQTWCFDAKECCTSKWYPGHAPPHQLEALRKAQGIGKRAAWLIWFRGTDNPTTELRWVEDLETPATVNSGVSFDWEMFL